MTSLCTNRSKSYRFSFYLFINSNGSLEAISSLNFKNEILYSEGISVTSTTYTKELSFVNSTSSICSIFTIYRILSSPYTLTFPGSLGSINSVLSTDGNGNLSWTSNGTPGGPNYSVQYVGSTNNFCGSSNLLYTTNNTLSMNGTLECTNYLNSSEYSTINSVILVNTSTSSYLSLESVGLVSSYTLSLPGNIGTSSKALG